jgi:hypothetical protein
MSASYSTALKNMRMSAVGVLIDGGAGAGYMELYTTGFGTLLATVTFGDPSISGSATAGAIVWAGFPKSVSAVAAGTIQAARMRDSNNTTVVNDMVVSTTATEVTVDNTNVVTGQVIVINSITFTHG